MDNNADTARNPLQSILYTLNRRWFLAGSGALTLLAAVAASRPSRQGAPHSSYFEALGKALRDNNCARPTLVVDRERFHHNIDAVTRSLAPHMKYRIVAKSIPSLPLIQEVMTRAQTNRLMVFHQPFLNLVAAEIPDADILLGKPMPVDAAARFYRTFSPGGLDPARQIQWLVDTPARLAQYQALANQMDLKLRINLELDVGLHRGGLTHPSQLRPVLETISADPRLTFSGFMGYEPHLAKIPSLMGWQARAVRASIDIYKGFIQAARDHFGQSWNAETLTLNTAGSPTYRFHDESTHVNEVAVGSALVKPTDFDTETLREHVPACFISTPVLKAMEKTDMPGLEMLTGMLRLWNPNRARAWFIYGGYWKALPESPQGLHYNTMFRSSNQEMLNGSSRINLLPDDLVFLRPTQSEFVFLQFGDIAVYEKGRIVKTWPVFTQDA